MLAPIGWDPGMGHDRWQGITMKRSKRSRSLSRKASKPPARTARASEILAKPPSVLPPLDDARKLYMETHPGRQTSSREDLHFEFTTLVTQFSRRWRNRLNEQLAELGQTQARVESLFWIEVAGGRATQRELADRVGIEGPTFARMLDTLEKEGLVERRVSRDDRRTKTIALKRHAVPGLKRIGEVVGAARRDLLQDVDEKELLAVVSLMRILMAKLERR
jgi:MarR family transcriptional regulator, transcriptional regulator for hemolysin